MADVDDVRHACSVCGADSVEHPSRSYNCGERHWPSLCCPGCGCLSFEEAHTYPHGDHGPNGETRLWLVAGHLLGDARVVHLPQLPLDLKPAVEHEGRMAMCGRYARWSRYTPGRGSEWAPRVCRRCAKRNERTPA